MPHFSDTIVARSTPRGYSGIGVIRLSGPHAVPLLRTVFRPATPSPFPDRTACYGVVCDPSSGKILDDGIAVVMRGPGSYTGEDVVELSLHGSPVVLDMVERLIVSLGARIAGRGEFTRRAFLAGRMDLVQAEAIIDLIEAAAPSAAEEARSRIDRSLSHEIRRLSGELKDLLAELEAHIDFDEDEIELLPNPLPTLVTLITSMDNLLRRSETGRIAREGLKTAIVGKPNVGKSTLFNAFLKCDRAIVTPYPGTTRDTLDERIAIQGRMFVLCDTAGVREAPDPIEEEGIRRTHALMAQADIRIVVIDASATLDHEDLNVLHAFPAIPAIVVLNKADLGTVVDQGADQLGPPSRPRVCMTARTGAGLDQLEQVLYREAERFSADAGRGMPGSLNHRGAMLMRSARRPLASLMERFTKGESIEPEIVALEVSEALAPLEEITGEKVDEGILDRIFQKFCVGK